MTRDVKVCCADETCNRAAELMWENDCGAIPVISTDGTGTVVGIVTDRDIAMAAYTQGKALSQIPVSSAMAQKVITCRAAEGITQAEALMRDNAVRRLPVVDRNDHLVGIISLNDIAREAQRERRAELRTREVSTDGVAETLADICKPRVLEPAAVAA